MDFPDIKLIKIKRQRLGLKQRELAGLAGVSQSLIAKLESGKIEASYSVVRNIFNALENAAKKNERLCKDIMIKRIISVKPEDGMLKARELMKKHDISQLPVIKNKRIVGNISESIILDNIEKDFSKVKVGDIMGNPFPTLSSDTPVSSVVGLIKQTDAVILTDKDSLSGILTKANLL